MRMNFVWRAACLIASSMNFGDLECCGASKGTL